MQGSRDGSDVAKQNTFASHNAKGNGPHKNSSRWEIAKAFVLWKLFLLLVAISSPGPGYDTSTHILLGEHAKAKPPWLKQAVNHLGLRLTRWDAIYFTNSSTRGHLYEQEWAFSWVLSRIMALVASGLYPFGLGSATHAAAGIIIAHLSHLLATMVLHKLAEELIPLKSASRRSPIALLTAVLFIISPAGIFLSAPFGESTYALFSFCGTLSYVYALRTKSAPARAYFLQAFWTLAASVCFAFAAMIRGNGLLNGVIFAWDSLQALWGLLQSPRKSPLWFDLFFSGAAGALLAIGFAFPQAVAYLEFCTTESPRSWCSNIPPSVYTFVQSYYWNVGFLKYWTLSNLPLFLLAFPVSWLMATTALRALSAGPELLVDENTMAAKSRKQLSQRQITEQVVSRLALIQLILVTMAITSFHCQIINRISSGYPLWYMLLAVEIEAQNTSTTVLRRGIFNSRIPSFRMDWVVRGFVLYAAIQGGLFAAFLPPA